MTYILECREQWQREGQKAFQGSLERQLCRPIAQMRGSQYSGLEWPGSNVLTPELCKRLITAVWQMHQRGREPSQRDQGKGYCNGVDER